MDKNKLLAGIAAILTTLAETGEGPDGVMYAAMMSRYSLSEYQAVTGFLEREGMIERSGMVLRIAPKGRALADKINAAMV